MAPGQTKPGSSSNAPNKKIATIGVSIAALLLRRNTVFGANHAFFKKKKKRGAICEHTQKTKMAAVGYSFSLLIMCIQKEKKHVWPFHRIFLLLIAEIHDHAPLKKKKNQQLHLVRIKMM